MLKLHVLSLLQQPILPERSIYESILKLYVYYLLALLTVNFLKAESNLFKLCISSRYSKGPLIVMLTHKHH